MMTVTQIRTVTPLATWQRMARKAEIEHLRAFKLNGDPRYWVVTSSSNRGAAYEVTVHDDDLICSCRASEFLPYCKHRALVLQALGALDETEHAIAA